MTGQIERIFKALDNGASLREIMLEDDGPVCDKIALNNDLVFHKGFKGVHEITKNRVRLVLYRPNSVVCKKCRRCLDN